MKRGLTSKQKRNIAKQKELSRLDKIIEEMEERGENAVSIIIKRDNIADDYKVGCPFKHYRGTIK